MERPGPPTPGRGRPAWRARQSVWVALGLTSCLVLSGFQQAAAAPRPKPPDPLVRVSDLSPFEPGCEGAPPAGDNRNSEVEPWLAVNPANRKNLIGAWQQDRLLAGAAAGVLSALSTDGGATWSGAAAPTFSRCAGGTAQNGGDYERATDPWVTFGADGDAYQASLSLSGFLIFGPSAILISKSQDGGRTWGEVTTLIRDQGPIFANDKEALTADPLDSRFVYAVWTRFEALDPRNPLFGPFTGPTYFSRTTDGGESWDPPRSIFDTGVNAQTLANQIAVLPSGELVNVFIGIVDSDQSLGVIRSTDRGTTWSPEIRVASIQPALVRDPRDGLTVRTGLPDIAVDPRKGSSNVYLVWEDGRFDSNHSQVAFASSADGGLTWTGPKRVSENPDVHAFGPSVEVNTKGEVGVTYYDLTHDTASSEALETDYWITASADGGDTFAPRRRLTPESGDVRTAPTTLAGVFVFGPFLGDYQGLAAAGKDFHALFSFPTSDPSNPADLSSVATRWRTPDLRRGPHNGPVAAAPDRQPSALAAPKEVVRRSPRR